MRRFIALSLILASCTSGTSVDDTSGPSTSTTMLVSTTIPEPSITVVAPFPATRFDIGLGWESIDVPSEVPTSCHRALVGTDTELIIWGGDQRSCDYEFPAGDPGMAYNPETGIWRQLAPSPLGPVVAATGVWTGQEVIICCGLTNTRQAAAYDPTHDSWRVIAPAPLYGPVPESVWTGEEMVVVTQLGVAAYNVDTDEWRSFELPPTRLGRTNEIVWTGSEIVIWPRFPDGDPLRRVEKGAALDPTTETWRVLSDPPEWPSWLDMVYTGRELIIWGGLPAPGPGSERAVGSRYHLATRAWTALPEPLPEPDGCECNLGSQTLTWTGEYLLVSPGHFSSGVDPSKPVLLAYHPDTDTWILVARDSPLAWGGESLTVGDRLVMVRERVMFISPPNWQPEGEIITFETWAP